MLQIVEGQMECDDDWEGVVYKLGNGQKIETLMAHQESLKVFRIWQGVGRRRTSSTGFRDRPFDDDDADYVASVVQRWYAFGAQDLSIEDVRLPSYVTHLFGVVDKSYPFEEKLS